MRIQPLPTTREWRRRFGWLRPHSWGLSLQHRLSPGLLLQVGYLGSRSINRLETISINDAVPGEGDRSARRPYPALQTVEMPFAGADAWFHGMQMQVEKRPDRYGFSALVVLDWSRQIDNGGGYQGPPSRRRFRSRNMPPAANRGPVRIPCAQTHDGDRRLRSALRSRTSPAVRRVGREGVGRMVDRAISSLQDGGWFTVYLPGDPLDTGSYHSQWPDRIRNPNLADSERSPSRWFDTGAFRRPGGVPLRERGTELGGGAGRDQSGPFTPAHPSSSRTAGGWSCAWKHSTPPTIPTSC